MRGDTYYSQSIKPSQRLCNTQVSKWNASSRKLLRSGARHRCTKSGNRLWKVVLTFIEYDSVEDGS